MIRVIVDDGTHVYAGEHKLACITQQTPQEALVKFIELCNQNDTELTELGIEYEAKRQWNFESKGNGKNWPVFSKIERLVNRLCKEAGIIDS